MNQRYGRPRGVRQFTIVVLLAVLAVTLRPVPAQAQDSTPDPMAYWALDEGAGTVAVDQVGGNTITLINGLTWQPRQAGSALLFDGTDDYGEIADSALSPNVPGQGRWEAGRRATQGCA